MLSATSQAAKASISELESSFMIQLTNEYALHIEYVHTSLVPLQLGDPADGPIWNNPEPDKSYIPPHDRQRANY